MIGELYEDEKIKPEEKAIKSRMAFAKLLPLLRVHRHGLLVCLFLLTGGTLLSISWPILLKRALDVNIKDGDFKGLLITVGAIGLIQLTTLTLQYIQRIKLETIGQNIMVDLKRKLFNHILSLDVSFFDKNPVGRLMARVESDTESLRMLFTNTVVLVIGDLILIAGIYSIMFYYSWRLASILIVIVPVVATLMYIFQKITTPRFFEVRKKMAEVTAKLAEFLHGMSIIQIFHRGAYAREQVYRANEAKFKDDVFVNIGVCIFFNTVFFFQYLMIALTLYFGVKWVQSGTITVGTIGMFIILIWRTFDPIWRASEQLSTIQKGIAGARRVFALLATEQVIYDPAQPVEWKKLEKSIRFENVWFSYTGDENWALKDANFEIPVGKRIALAGVTGGGKSTVISLLLRLYDPQKGRILVDGIDIRNISRDELRRRFALVLQDIILFPGDVKSNISLESENISEESVKSAAATVQADQFIGRLPKGFETEVSEKGANFSRGERQLLSFARALAVDPDVLVLDEATSSVDPETERTIQESLRKLMAGRTSLVIAHRLSTILDVDEILVIRRGEIIERGTHTELILKNGYYSKLFHLQFKNRNGVVVNAK
ncbi:MAG: antibiotic ABC transporter ATP-binding protein [candidate division Zixibacteria bacterium HGW-Zixibacteria-1]|nr:MAG: antibiotic ABC transporter ATP-binding protein [candidate division Zixibacteria bacterium HGW-Zixibacteria-1]